MMTVEVGITQPSESLGLIHGFPVVGIGASAGGLEALKQFFTAMPPETGLAFVLVQHLDPNHESLMADLMAKYAAMSVAKLWMDCVSPNHVYVIPRSLSVHARRGSALEPAHRTAWHAHAHRSLFALPGRGVGREGHLRDSFRHG
ncbi:MAG: chemotaxis protein CheB [Candidatus Competibacteraceae bacterium]